MQEAFAVAVEGDTESYSSGLGSRWTGSWVKRGPGTSLGSLDSLGGLVSGGAGWLSVLITVSAASVSPDGTEDESGC